MATREIRQRVFAEARISPSARRAVEQQLKGLPRKATVQDLWDAIAAMENHQLRSSSERQ